MGRREFGTRFQEALILAATVHRGQTRKGTSIPYIAHPLAVCALVLENGGDEDEAIAALLHDTLEDHPETVSREALRERFGERVLSAVEGCTDTPPDYRGGPKPPWRERKQAYIYRIRNEGTGYARVALADKLHSARSILTDFRLLGDLLWSRFSAGRDEQLWYFRSLVSAFEEAGAPPGMLEEYSRTVTELERLANAG